MMEAEAKVVNEIEKPTLDEDVIVKIPKNMPQVEHNLGAVKEFAEKLVKYYSNLVFDTDNSKEAESEKTKINKLIKTISDLRKENVKKYKEPIDDFEKTAKEIESLLKEAVGDVQRYIDKAEAKRKFEKDEKVIIPIINNAISNAFIQGYLINRESIIYDKRWYNKTFKDSDIEEDVNSQVKELIRQEDEFNKGLEVIKHTLIMATQMDIARDFDKYAERFNYTRDLTSILNDIEQEDDSRKNKLSTVKETPIKFDNANMFERDSHFIVQATFKGTEEQMLKLRQYATSLGMEEI